MGIMSFKDDIAAVKENTPKPLLVPVALNGKLYQVETKRLPGTTWDSILSRSPAKTEAHFRIGYDSGTATKIACREHARLIDPDGDPVDMAPTKDERGNVTSDPWADLFEAMSGLELRAISGAWWGLNESDPNKEISALKKALRGDESSSSNSPLN